MYFISYHLFAFALCLHAALALAEPPAQEPNQNPQNSEQKLIIGPIANSVGFGAQDSYGSCHCTRWMIDVELANGQVETRDFIVSSDGIFKFHQTEVYPYFNFRANQTFEIASLEVAFKENRSGLQFKGITVQNDRDLGYKGLFQTGLSFFWSLIHSKTTDFKLDLDYDFQKFQINEGADVKRIIASEGGKLKLEFPHFKANIKSSVGEHIFDAQEVRFGFKTDVSLLPYINLSRFQIGAGLDLKYQYDPIREVHNLFPHVAIVGLKLSVAHVLPQKMVQISDVPKEEQTP